MKSKINIMRESEKLDLIMLVEDEEDHGRLIINALEKEVRLMNKIVWLKNGQDAIEYLRNDGTQKPGLILLDVKLPLKNGFEVLKELKTQDNLKPIPVVMLTTTSNSDDIKNALQLGANDYIVKPIRFSDFISTVASLGSYWAFVSDSNYGLKAKTV